MVPTLSSFSDFFFNFLSEPFLSGIVKSPQGCSCGVGLER